MLVFPKEAELSDGFQTPIIAFEFARTEVDLAFLAGDSEASQRNRRLMDEGHFWDMAFPFAYGGLLALLLLQFTGQGYRFVWVGVVCSILIIPFDINENLTLLSITAALEESRPVVPLLVDLHTATWLKWGVLGISIALLSASYLTRKRYGFALLSLLASLAIAICWVSGSEPRFAEAMSKVLSLFFIVIAINAIVQAWTFAKGNRLS
ncbi:hypothetical protein MIB92_13235 [Aestuariirhabdus sp. Z084]|uniref:hypothetical protein n=1 Tax=Aestuariirhabdus haliotis TaxID=2918751 RepID=UPI00201B3B92|nr:hypothetical protein [Aestuariirhabdus haliotis]MCL6416617.1 hypothetical protein [Aestuariirhabdus haliotis]MCL6420652.1 hypothetical protein [Aestuariirhabdus haliotis]